MGARNAALGGATTTTGDQWSLFNNVGALGLVDGSYAFSSYQNRFNIAEFQTVGAGFVHDFGGLVGGAGFYKFGDEFFSEQRVNVAFGHKLDRVSLGVSVDYLQYNIATVGTKGAVIIEFGGVAEITEQILFGAHVFNINQARLVKETDERLPTVMKAGLSFLASADLVISIETEKDLDYDEVFRVGVEYQIVENLFIRTGLSTEPFNGAFGVGFQPKRFQIDYAFSNDSNLGSVHEVSVSYSLLKL